MKGQQKMETVKGYKGFNEDMTCRGFQYEIGKEYVHKGAIELCGSGFHFCKKIEDVQRFYDIEHNKILCEIEATGEVLEEDKKCTTNKIKIIREIEKEEMYELANEGRNNIGLGNTGDRNTGDRNTGDNNTGYWNTGNNNTGYSNTGYSNTGDSNTGDRNTGNRNTGDRNTGNWNTGYNNTGYSNTGDWNTGDWNTGNRNTGDWNTGDWNTGDWNKTNRSAGVFCNKEPKMVMFNKETDMTWKEWKNSEAYDILSKVIKSQWIVYNDMTVKEKSEQKHAKTCGGYLKETKRKTGSKEWWENLEMYEKATIVQLPNFDLDIFNDIMEFKVSKKEYKEILKWLKSR
jgi:hypothetical protein